MVTRPEQEYAWWQKALIKAKIWQPPHRTLHHVVRDMERPVPPPVTGAYGNRIVTATRRRLVPQHGDDQR
ncbi:hypothetical protein [Ornithinimicrobium cryptoxanthini]|uniref:PH domain-containing protein n=1 Tax=Ornithinimicrobium cryptoxanthini TaxID=2934161 RepID=A0ABY4YFS4_9MICO|nr:hypothetical protein [Ornithinimicrobium cryptoxanthini]USQ75381.1 hypothetical protein NF557_12210 [Ornithinimicrobium cryptoxanthini]